MENPEASKEELADLVFEAVESGQAIVIGPDQKIAFSDQVAVGDTKLADNIQQNNDVTTQAPTWQTTSD